MRLCRVLVTFVWVLVVCGVPASAARQSCEIPAGASVALLLEIQGRCPTRFAEVQAAIHGRGDAAVRPLLDAYESRPDLRGGVVRTLAGMGDAGSDGLRDLGSDGLHVLARSRPSRNEVAAALRALGGPALEMLIPMLDDGDHQVRVFAAQSLRSFGTEALDALLEAAETNPDPSVRRICAQSATHLDGRKALPSLLRRLGSEDLNARERSSLARLLLRIDDPAARDALVSLLRDPSVGRQQRWSLALRMKKSAHPDLVAAAQEYGPSGGRGEGNPESPLGNVLATVLLGVAVAVVILVKGDLARSERVGLVLGGTVAAYISALVVLPLFMMMLLGLGRFPLWLAPGALAAVWAGAALGVRTVRRPGLPPGTVPVVASGASVGFVAGWLLDRYVNWYLDRIANDLFGFLRSPLVLGVTVVRTLATTYLISARRRPES